MHILTDAADVRRCRECDKAICSHCVQTHGRQPQTVSHALTEITSVVRETEVLEEKLARVPGDNEFLLQHTSGLNLDVQIGANDLQRAVCGNAMCSTGCEGGDAGATHWCKNCGRALCGICATRHTRSHVLFELAVLRAQQELEDKLSRVRKTSLEERRRSKALGEEMEQKKLEVSAQFKAEEENRILEFKAEEEKRIRELVTEAAQRKVEEEKRIRELEEETARIKAAAEEETRRRQEEEDELVLEKQKLEEVLVSSVLSTPRSNAIGFISPRSPAVEEFPSNLSAMTHTDASIPIDPRASPMAVSMADQHNRKVDDQLCQAQHRAEEGELVHQLQVARTSEEEICRNSEKRLLHPFLTEETIKTPIAHTGVAAASSASSTRPQLVETPRQRVPTEKMERLKIETSPDVLESRQGEADWVKRKERETDRAAEVAVDTQADHSITESVHPTGAFTLPLEAIVMPVSHTRVAVPAAPSASAPFPRSTGTETPGRAVDFSPARSAQAGLSVPLFLFLSRARALSLSLSPSLPPSLCSALSRTLTKTDLSAYKI